MVERPICEVTGKICYNTLGEATSIVKKIKKARNSKRPKIIPQRAYKCKHCGFYHLTHYRRLETCKATLRRYGARSGKRFSSMEEE